MRGWFARLSIARKQAVWAWVFLAVPLVFFTVVRFWPATDAFMLSLSRWNLVGKRQYIGLENYDRLVHDPVFWQVLGNTFEYLLIGLPVSLLLSFVVAFQLDRVQHGHALLRALYFLPHLTTATAMAWVWRWFYQPAPVGVFNGWLGVLGFAQQPFLRSTTEALPAVLAPAIWAALGFQIIIFMAGLKAIPRSYYEAAEIDGAGGWQILREITVPLLLPSFVFLFITTSIGLLRIFDQVYNMTDGGEGGPLNATKPLVLSIYQSAFARMDMGYASAQTVVLFAILLVLSLLQMRLLRARR
jgi:multiple sugar transport system permease protein